ncbi:MAG: hypothetical protein WAN36_02915, partial [Calditrichia bacterium]
ELEYAGKTNFKIRFKRPNKNVWSVPFQDFRESIRHVLREGRLNAVEAEEDHQKETMDLPTLLLLHVLPDEEFARRSFVGNKVDHPTMGEGRIVRITASGNVVVEFLERQVKLKPGFIKLKTS